MVNRREDQPVEPVNEPDREQPTQPEPTNPADNPNEPR